MGDPAPARVSGPRTFVRQCPSTRIPLPSPAAAAACLPTSGPPALFGTRRAARCLCSGTTGFSPSRAMRRTTTSAATPVSPALRVSAQCGFLPSVVPPPSPRYRGCGGPCPAMRRPPTPLRRGLALGRHLLSVTPSRRALPSRPRRAWRPFDAGHSSTASPRRHQLSSYRNACRYWPEGRFRAPSLPEFRQPRIQSRRKNGTSCNTAGSDGAPYGARG